MVEIYFDDLSTSLSQKCRTELNIDQIIQLPLSNFFDNFNRYSDQEKGGTTKFACVSDIRTAFNLSGSTVRVVHERLVFGQLPSDTFSQVLLKVGREQTEVVRKLVMERQPVVPLFGGCDVWLLAATPSAAIDLIKVGERIGAVDILATHDIYLMRDEEMQPEGFFATPDGVFGKGAILLTRVTEGLIVAIPADASIDDFHFPHTHHGHNLKLIADPALVEVRTADAAFVAEPGQVPLDEDIELVRTAIQPDMIAALVGLLSGELDGPVGKISSRHIHHSDCERALDLIRASLREAGLEPVDHKFFHEGNVYANIYADIAGSSDDLVLLTAHLDSTAGRDDPDYRGASDPAPGADDDASGVAAVLAFAQAAAGIAGRSATIRLVLFHAEEHGLVGSRHFARAAAAEGHRIRGVIQMDMIGFRPNQDERRVEIHYGCAARPEVELQSAAVAELLRHSVEVLGELAPIEIYRSPNDPADGRSDHSSLQMSGYPAAIISEDFFGGSVEQPGGPPNNPQYHSATDTRIDTGYATSIARAASLAALTAAR